MARTIKTSLAMVIPVLFIGSVTVLLNGFPVQAYQDFLDTFLNGALRSMILTIQLTTLGILAVYLTAALNLCYMNQTEEGQRLVFRFGSLLGCVTGFLFSWVFFPGSQISHCLAGRGYLVRF